MFCSTSLSRSLSISVAKIFAQSPVDSASWVVLVPGAEQRSRIVQLDFGERSFTTEAEAGS